VNDHIRLGIEHARMRCVHASEVPYYPPASLPPIPPGLDSEERDRRFRAAMDEAGRIGMGGE
jgi:hypothetical protein